MDYIKRSVSVFYGLIWVVCKSWDLNENQLLLLKLQSLMTENQWADLPENKSCHVGGLPVGGVEKVRQSHGGEGGQNVGTVQSVIQPLGAPPAS